MGDQINKPNNANEEIDLFQLFNYFESKVIGLFKGVFSVFKKLFSIVIYFLQALQANIKILGPLLVLAIILGYFLDKNEDRKYSSEMLVQPYFEAKYQLYANIEYYNSLLADKDYETLKNIFGIELEQAEQIKRFEMYPGPETENQLRKEYYAFVEDITLKSADPMEGEEDEAKPKVVLDVSFEEFVEGRSIYSSDKFMIKAISTKKDIFQHLEEGLNKSFDNEYSKKNMKKRDSVITLRKMAVQKQINQIDSLQSVYIDAFKENVKASTSQIEVNESGFALADSKVETKEYELLEKKTKLIDELRRLEESKVEEDTFFDVIASFPKIGKLESQKVYLKKIILFPIAAFMLFVFYLFGRRFNTYVKNYE